MKLIELPGEEYGDLLPENQAEPVTVGNKVYKMFPFTLKDWLIVREEFSGAIKTIPIDSSLIDTVIHGIQNTLPAVLKRMGADPKEVEQITAKQIQHAATVIYRQNFDIEGLPAASKKNLQQFWNLIKPLVTPILDDLKKDLENIPGLTEPEEHPEKK